jgi:hypothetical protein
MPKASFSNTVILAMERISLISLKQLMGHKVTLPLYCLGLGILFVNGIPDYPEARKATLPSIWQMGNLPKETLKKY